MNLFSVDLIMYLFLFVFGSLLFFYLSKSLKKTINIFIILYILMFLIAIRPLLFVPDDRFMFLQVFLALSIVLIMLVIAKTILDKISIKRKILK